MISVNNQFRENDLEIEFSGESIDDTSINISVLNDVNFKPIVDYLINLIPKKDKLDSNFEDFSEKDNLEKLILIEETIKDIYEAYNVSIDDDQEPAL